jgi:parallel beta-helix repeat protein
MKGFTLVLAVTLLSPGASRGRAESGTHTLTCGHERTIGQALKTLKPGDTLLVSGTCNENLVIDEALHGITLDGQGRAAINGDSSANAVTVTGNGITIRGFVVTGGNPQAIAVQDGGTAVIDGNTIQFSARNGIAVFRGSSANIVNNTIQNNGPRESSATSTARIGWSVA